MERITNEDTARSRLSRLTQADSNPIITSSLQDILAECRLASLWQASTAYSVGTVIQPNTPNGKRYVCVTAGTSGTTEPTFATGRDSTTSDGTTLVWQEDGDEYASLWDLRRAAYLGWKEKASKAVCAVDVKAGDQAFSNSQIFDHCEAMAKKFMPVMVA